MFHRFECHLVKRPKSVQEVVGFIDLDIKFEIKVKVGNRQPSNSLLGRNVHEICHSVKTEYLLSVMA